MGHGLITAEAGKLMQQVQGVGPFGKDVRGRTELDPVGHLFPRGRRRGRAVSLLFGRAGRCDNPRSTDACRDKPFKLRLDLLGQPGSDGTAAVVSVEHLFDPVAGPQGKIDDLLGDRDLPFAHEVEKILDLMRKSRNIGELAGAARTLDGMHHPEHPADMFLVPRGFLELQQRGFELGKQVLRLFLECFTEFGDYLLSGLFVYGFPVLGHCALLLYLAVQRQVLSLSRLHPV